MGFLFDTWGASWIRSNRDTWGGSWGLSAATEEEEETIPAISGFSPWEPYRRLKPDWRKMRRKRHSEQLVLMGGG